MKTQSHKQLIQRLIERGWMPIQIAQEIGVSKSTISRLQNTKTMPSFKTGMRLAELVSNRRKPPRTWGKNHVDS